MITENYISFEVAKLLKEKGFDEKCSHYWQNEISEYSIPKEIYKWTDSAFANTEINDSERFSAPTHQMVLKWLREVHNIDIEVRTHYLNYLKPNDTRYYSGKILKGSEDVIHTIYSKDTYEQVCETAIKYCLENLI